MLCRKRAHSLKPQNLSKIFIGELNNSLAHRPLRRRWTSVAPELALSKCQISKLPSLASSTLQFAEPVPQKMALKWPIPFPIFAPLLNTTPTPNPSHHRPRPPGEVRFSRWNNANAEKFNERRRAQQEIEDDIRRERRFDSATRISTIEEDGSAATDNSATTSNGQTFKSIGTPSLPSRPSIPGKKSKYSKNPYPNHNHNSNDSHPAFRQFPRTSMKIPNLPEENNPLISRQASVSVDEDGLSYVIDGAPFEFKYSYTETPKARPIKLREPPYAPFGPTTMPRPWTGRAPLPPSKKKMREFDSFRLPPPHKKGVKPVQAPGPFLPGSGPKYVMSREEILGEPLTEEEIKDLINGCIKSKRQLNMGRDGLTHNMLDNIHAHWKRRRVCKIKCKGVCTVDMDNVRQQLEERTGGKIIYSKGGVIYLFRGRNYNSKTRPRFPLMLWKPVTPLYPRLVQRVPEGLTLEEATEMRKKGRSLTPICKLGKNGVYIDMVKNVREAFEECEIVRINCQGMNKSDYRKIGAKLKDLVPCVLISFEREHILMWRGKDWKSSLPKLDQDCREVMASDSGVGNAASVSPSFEGQEESPSSDLVVLVNNESSEVLSTGTPHVGSEDLGVEESGGSSIIECVDPLAATDAVSTVGMTYGTKTVPNVQSPADDVLEAIRNAGYSAAGRSDDPGYAGNEPAITSNISGSNTTLDNADCVDGQPSDDPGYAGNEPPIASNISGSNTTLDNADCVDGQPSVDMGSETTLLATESTETNLDSVEASHIDNENLQVVSESLQGTSHPARSPALCTEGVITLLKQAVVGGSAIILEDSYLDADIVYQKAVAFAKSAPPEPVFRHGPRKVLFKKSEGRKSEEQESEEMESKQITTVPVKKGKEKKGSKIQRRKDFGGRLDNVVPQGSLGVDELAKLLA